MNDQQNNLLAAAEILSLILAYENLIENRAQSRSNDVNEANDKQANYLISELGRKFDEQNEILRAMNEKLDFLISLYFEGGK